MSGHIMLICTVGGSPEPIVAALKHWQPQRIIFLTSKETKAQVEEQVIPLARQEGLNIPIGCYDVYSLADAQDFIDCVKKNKERTPDVEKWLSRGEGYQIIVDFTGGTKCMTSALALTAHHWPCQFSYVGGVERTKAGVGIVVKGKEQVLHCQNPWDVLGYQAVEETVTLWDHYAFAAAAKLLRDVQEKITDPTTKREIATLKNLAEAYAAWDRFDHGKAEELLKTAIKNANDFLALFGVVTKECLVSTINTHLEHLRYLTNAKNITWTLVLDLLANAKRRAEIERFDEATACLYRATEAMAQVQLREKYDFDDTGRVLLEKVPATLRSKWTSRSEGGFVRLGLQDDYDLLQALGDELAKRFIDLDWHDKKRSPLSSRNQSILAHGFKPVGQNVYQRLWEGCVQLAKVDESNLLNFPKLARWE